MALYYSRLLCRRSINVQNFRSLYTSSSQNVAVSKPMCMGSVVCESHSEKNERLKRPMSPHMTIYQSQLTWILSLTHRTTGLILSSYAATLGLGTLFIPGGIPCLIEMVQELGLSAPVLFAGKTMLALPLTYHWCNGIRHLAWDLGFYLTIKEVYSSGYLVTAASIIFAIVLAKL